MVNDPRPYDWSEQDDFTDPAEGSPLDAGPTDHYAASGMVMPEGGWPKPRDRAEAAGRVVGYAIIGLVVGFVGCLIVLGLLAFIGLVFL